MAERSGFGQPAGSRQPDVALEPVTLEALAASDNLLQSGFWGAHKARFGWKPYPFKVAVDSGHAGELLVLSRALPFGDLAYIPHGPSRPVLDRGIQGLASLAEAVGDAMASSPLLVRYDLIGPIHEGESAPAKASFFDANGSGGVRRGLRPAPVDVQPASTVLVDIGRDDGEILASMKPKTRYNVRLAAKKGVEAVRIDARGLDRWYDLYRETAERDHIAIHSFEYYSALFELAETFSGAVPDIRLYMARHEGNDLAGIITAFFGNRATYLYGASSNEKRNLMPAYLLQWTAMRDARDAGCTEYDLFGIPPRDDPSHSMGGLYRFKTGFGGRVIHMPGCWDYPLRRSRYAAYRLAEAARSYYFHTLKKRRGARGT